MLRRGGSRVLRIRPVRSSGAAGGRNVVLMENIPPTFTSEGLPFPCKLLVARYYKMSINVTAGKDKEKEEKCAGNK